MSSLVSASGAAHIDYVLRLADSSLILGHRLSEWCGHGPVLEEDIALTNIALDLLGQARSLYSHAGALEDIGRDEDRFAFDRTADEFRNVSIVELPNDDYGCTIMRNFLFTVFQSELWTALLQSADAGVAEIAGKSLKETRYHVRHASDWTIRLGDGTEESHARMQRALNHLWPYTAELFSSSTTDDAAARAAIGPAWSTLEARWHAAVRPVLDIATLQTPERTAFLSRGKEGVHGEHMQHLLAQMQFLQRTYPSCKW